MSTTFLTSTTSVAPVRLAYANIFAKDIDALSKFYSALFGFRRIEAHESPIYRCLDAGGIELGFNAQKAYELLGLADHKPDAIDSVSVYFTFEVASSANVDLAADNVVTLGGGIVKPPYDTYYNARQAVLRDPEWHIFRVNHRKGPRIPAMDIRQPPWA